jgi:hypothetical protein
MTERTARALADMLIGQATWPMPCTRAWGVSLDRLDGRFVVLEDHAGWVYRDRAAYDAYHRDGDPDAIVDSAEWGEWGVRESWAAPLARLIGGEAHQSGGNIWVVLYRRPDGRFIVLGDDGAEIYESAEHYERYYDGDRPEPGFVYWSDLPARS